MVVSLPTRLNLEFDSVNYIVNIHGKEPRCAT